MMLTLSINWGTTHFVSMADVLVRGIFFPAIAILLGIIIYRMVKDWKNTDWDTLNAEHDAYLEAEDYSDDFDMVFEKIEEEAEDNVLVIHVSTLEMWKRQGLLLSTLTIIAGLIAIASGIVMVVMGHDKVLTALGIVLIVASALATWLSPYIWNWAED